MMTRDYGKGYDEGYSDGLKDASQRKPLTDEEIWKFWCSRPEVPEGEDDSMEAEFVAAVRAVLAAIEAKLKEKNA